MRRLWLDELPMLYNWLKGDLGLVGVRPLSYQYLSLYDRELRELRELRKKVRPGLVPPYYADLPDTFNMDPDRIEAAITPKTRAIMPVGIYGQCADMTRINAIADRHDIPVIEDAAQCFGATHHGRWSCNLLLIGCTSFFPSKPLGCYGDGVPFLRRTMIWRTSRTSPRLSSHRAAQCLSPTTGADTVGGEEPEKRETRQKRKKQVQLQPGGKGI